MNKIIITKEEEIQALVDDDRSDFIKNVGEEGSKRFEDYDYKDLLLDTDMLEVEMDRLLGDESQHLTEAKKVLRSPNRNHEDWLLFTLGFVMDGFSRNESEKVYLSLSPQHKSEAQKVANDFINGISQKWLFSK